MVKELQINKRNNKKLETIENWTEDIVSISLKKMLEQLIMN